MIISNDVSLEVHYDLAVIVIVTVVSAVSALLYSSVIVIAVASKLNHEPSNPPEKLA